MRGASLKVYAVDWNLLPPTGKNYMYMHADMIHRHKTERKTEMEWDLLSSLGKPEPEEEAPGPPLRLG